MVTNKQRVVLNALHERRLNYTFIFTSFSLTILVDFDVEIALLYALVNVLIYLLFWLVFDLTILCLIELSIYSSLL